MLITKPRKQKRGIWLLASPGLRSLNRETYQPTEIMCVANPIYHPCSHTSVIWLRCPAKEFNKDQPCQNVTLLHGEGSMEDCPLKYCRFSERDKGWICCHCQGGPNYTGWCSMPSGQSTFSSSDMDTATCNHGFCKHCFRVRGEVNLSLPFPSLV